MKSKKPSEEFQERLKEARALRQWSQSELAERANLPLSSIAHFEIGSRKPSFDNLRRLAIALDVTTDYLIGRANSPEMSESGNPFFRYASHLTGSDLELAEDFLKVLAKRNKQKSNKKGNS